MRPNQGRMPSLFAYAPDPEIENLQEKVSL